MPPSSPRRCCRSGSRRSSRRRLPAHTSTSNPVVPSLTLALAGDVMLGRNVNPMIAEHGFTYPWGDLLPTLTGADCFLLNLECALTDHTGRWQDGSYKPFYFRADPGVVETLRLAGVRFAALANNHAADFEM